ncbi:MAG: F0F1 ATP synthase subunit epsilon [Armatimonadaceae bacterium]
MASSFALDIVTPEKTVLSDYVTYVQLPAASGSMGILAGHAPLLAELGVGECMVKLPDGAEEMFVLSGGFVEVSREKVTVLADTAEHANEIDVNRAESALTRARQMLNSMDTMSATEREEANYAVQRAQARLRVARGGQ